MSSAVRSPMSRLYLRLMCWTMASSILSPPTRIDLDMTMPASEITATSVVPPPMSTIMLALGDDVAGRASEHLLGLFADGEHLLDAVVAALHRHHRGLVGDDALTFHER